MARLVGMSYRWETKTVEGFVQQAALYLRHGYWFYATGTIPPEKKPEDVDRKLLARYGVELSKWARARRRQQGIANLQYLRHGLNWILMATHGKHAFFDLEKNSIRDARHTPIKRWGYSLSYRQGMDGKGHAHVRINEECYKEFKAFLIELAERRQTGMMVHEFWQVPFEPYAPVRRQLLNVLREVNRVRKIQGLQLLPFSVIPFKRRIVKPFDDAPLEDSGGSFDMHER